MCCFSPLILEKLGSKPGRSGRVQVYSFLVWKNGFVQGENDSDFLFQLYHHNQLLFKE